MKTLLVFLAIVISCVIAYIQIKILISLSQSSGDGSKFIPKKIWQLCPDKNTLNDRLRTNIEKLKKLNPSWTHTLLDHNDVLEYLKKYFAPAVLKTYLSINPRYGAARTGLFRYLLLLREGGCYLDIKSSLTYPLDSILHENDRYILSYWAFGVECLTTDFQDTWGPEFEQWHIICEPMHPFLAAVIKSVFDNISTYDSNKYSDRSKDISKTMGPTAYTNAIRPLLRYHAHRFCETHHELGLIYSIFFLRGHKNHLLHYSKIHEPLILPDARQ